MNDNIYPISFNKEITKKGFDYIVEELRQVPDLFTPYVYFHTEGGWTTFASPLIHLFTVNDVTLVTTGRISSCGLDIFLNYTGKRIVLDGVEAMYHKGRRICDVDLKEDGSADLNKSLSRLHKESASSDFSKNTLSFLKLTKKEKKQYKKGEDIYFGSKRLREAVRRSENHFRKIKEIQDKT